MSQATKEIRYFLCSDHASNYEKRMLTYHPGYIFNVQPIVPPKKCSYTNCHEDGFWLAIGVQIPDSVGTLQETKVIVNEIFNNARQILGEGPALERLAVFLKSKLLPINTDLSAQLIIKHHAVSILQKLKINPNQPLTTKEINSILRELNLYPADYKNIT